MLNPNQFALLKFIREFAHEAPLTTRIKIYRGISDFLGASEDKPYRVTFSEMANTLQDAQDHCSQLELKLPR